jgi:hypothetical protein
MQKPLTLCGATCIWGESLSDMRRFGSVNRPQGRQAGFPPHLSESWPDTQAALLAAGPFGSRL